MSQPDTKPPQTASTPPQPTTPAKPPVDKPKPEPKPPDKSGDWAALGGLFLALLGLIIVMSNVTGFGESRNQAPVADQNEAGFNEVDFNPNNIEENTNLEFSDPLEPEFSQTAINEEDFSSDVINHSLPHIPTNTPCLEQPIRPIHPPPKPIKKH